MNKTRLENYIQFLDRIPYALWETMNRCEREARERQAFSDAQLVEEDFSDWDSFHSLLRDFHQDGSLINNISEAISKEIDLWKKQEF